MAESLCTKLFKCFKPKRKVTPDVEPHLKDSIPKDPTLITKKTFPGIFGERVRYKPKPRHIENAKVVIPAVYQSAGLESIDMAEFYSPISIRSKDSEDVMNSSMVIDSSSMSVSYTA